MPDDDAPGWDAIDAALAPVVGDRKAVHWGTGTTLPGAAGEPPARHRRSRPPLVSGSADQHVTPRRPALSLPGKVILTV